MRIRKYSLLMSVLLLLLLVFQTGRVESVMAATNYSVQNLASSPTNSTSVKPRAGNYPGWRSFPTPGHVTSLAIEGNAIWVGTGGNGVLKLDVATGNVLATYTTANSGLADNTILAIAIDGAGNKWFGTQFKGVSKFDGNTWTNYNVSNSGLADNYVQAIAIDKTNVKWFGTRNAGVSKFDGNAWKTYNVTNSTLRYNRINAIAIDSKNVKWFATGGNLVYCYELGVVSKFDNQTWTNIGGASFAYPNTVAVDASDNVWAGFQAGDSCEAVGGGAGLGKFDGSNWTYYNGPTTPPTNAGFLDNNIVGITFDKAGNGWFAGPGGLTKFDGTKWTAYYEPNASLDNFGDTAPVIDSDNNKWIGLRHEVSVLNENKALLKLNPDALTFVSPSGNNDSQIINLAAYNFDINWQSSVTYGAGASGWLNLSQNNGLLHQFTPITLTATVNTTNLTAGVYTATLTINDTTDPADEATLNVTLSVVSASNQIYNYSLPILRDFYYLPVHPVFQNAGNTTANVQIRYYNTAGNNINNPPGTCGSFPPHSECLTSNPVFGYPQYYNTIASDTLFTAILTSDQPLNILVASGSAYEPGPISSNLIVPLILKGAFNDFDTSLTIYNAGDSTTTATVTFYDNNGNLQPDVTQNLTLAPHTNAIISNGGILPALEKLPFGFYGWAQISGVPGSQLTAQILETNYLQAFSAYFPAQATDTVVSQTTLYAPAIFNGAFGSFVTGSAILNPNANPVTVTITYYDNTGVAIPTAPFSIAARSQASVYQGSATSGNGLPAGGLPKGFYGSAKVTSQGGGITMLVNEIGPTIYANGSYFATSSQSGTYVAKSAGSSSVGLPVIANNGFGYTTGLTVLNINEQTVNATIQYYNLDGTPQGQAQPFALAPHASQPYYQGAVGLPVSFYGTAVITQTSGPANSLLVTTNAISNASFYTYTEPN